MKKMNKKGFTIVELVIVIAVIAILAGVMIPTFSSIVTKANESKALQEARNVYTEIYAVDMADGVLDLEISDFTAANGINIPTGAQVQAYDYTENTSNVTSFKYKATNGIIVSFNGTAWTVSAT